MQNSELLDNQGKMDRALQESGFHLTYQKNMVTLAAKCPDTRD